LSDQGVDLSQSMIDAARIMTEGMNPNITFKTKLSDVLDRAATRKLRYDLTVRVCESRRTSIRSLT
jgi:hypothetical protein